MALPQASGSGAEGFRSRAFSAAATAAPVARPVILLTGFGPFPGVPQNASAEVVEELAHLCVPRFPDVSFAAATLPVDWRTSPEALAELLSAHRPAVALHFGVSVRASGFVIEQHAYNETRAGPDAAGRTAAHTRLVPGDRARRRATLPLQAIVRALERAGHPVLLSDDPGRYLCNAVLYHSLRHAARASPRVRTGFIHLPAALDRTAPGEAGRLGWAEAITGGLVLIETCLASLRGARRSLS